MRTESESGEGGEHSGSSDDRGSRSVDRSTSPGDAVLQRITEGKGSTVGPGTSGPTTATECEQYYGVEIDSPGEVATLQRLEATNGTETVRQWADEGMPIKAMGTPSKMDAFRQRKDSPVPWDIEQFNTESERRNTSKVRRIRREGPAGDTEVPDSVREVISSPGHSLEPSVQRTMEAQLGEDFDDVRVHTGPKAAQAADDIDARAFTVGNHVAFDRGEYDPGSPEGQHVIAHELAHVRQQSDGSVQRLPSDADLSVQRWPDLGNAADAVGDAASDAASAAGNAANDATDAATDAADDATDEVTKAASDAVAQADNASEEVQRTAQEAARMATKQGRDAHEAAQNAVRNVETEGKEAGQAIVEGLDEAGEVAGGMADDAGDGIDSFSQDATDALIDLREQSAEGVTPHANLPLGGAGREARARRERAFAQWAQGASDAMSNGQLPTLKETGGLIFQGGEMMERGLAGTGRWISQNSPTRGMGPEVMGEHVGTVPGYLAGGAVSGTGMLLGAVAQAPVTISADLSRTATGTESGLTPSELTGTGTMAENTARRFTTSTINDAKEHPLSTMLSLGFSASRVGRTGVRGYRSGRSADGASSGVALDSPTNDGPGGSSPAAGASGGGGFGTLRGVIEDSDSSLTPSELSPKRYDELRAVLDSRQDDLDATTYDSARLELEQLRLNRHSVEDLQATLERGTPIDTANLEGVSPESAREVAGTLMYESTRGNVDNLDRVTTSRSAVRENGLNPDSKGLYYPEERDIYLNKDFVDRNTNNNIIRQKHEEGWFAGSDPSYMIRHELGHHNHFERMRSNGRVFSRQQEFDQLGSFTSELEKRIRADVSEYATRRTPHELIAEIFSQKARGKRFESEIANGHTEVTTPSGRQVEINSLSDLYELYGGPTP